MSKSLKPWIAVLLPYDPTYRLCEVSDVVFQKSVLSRRVMALYRDEIVPPSWTWMFEHKVMNHSAIPITFLQKVRLTIFPVQPLPQHPGTLKRYHAPGVQGQVTTGGRVSAFPLGLVFHFEFPETGDQDILSRFKGEFDDFQDGFGGLDGFGLREATVAVNLVDDVGFGECHNRCLPFTGEDNFRCLFGQWV